MPDTAARVDPHPTQPQERPLMTASTSPTASKTLDDIPGPKGVPVLGNMFDIKQATLIQDLMKLAREWGPIFKLSSPNGPRYVVSGPRNGE
jgi:cytochrome P450/NADPH-cytochrome P450 reductase